MSADQFDAQLARISRKFAVLKARDRGREVFASEQHKYDLNPCWSEDRVRSWEERNGVTLPGDYRAFVRHFANGGAGPYYGVFPLDDGPAPGLAHPFPVSAGEVERLIADRKADPETEPDYPDVGPDPTGVLPICEYGCGGYFSLVVTGEAKGTVWFAMDGWLPQGEPGAGFLDWYEAWLDEHLIPGRLKDGDEVFDREPALVTGVNFRGRGLTSLPDGLRRLSAIATLDVSQNRITSVPEWIGDFADLWYLNVGSNPLSELPSDIGRLANLTHLHASSASLETVPASIGLASRLVKLGLGFNEVLAVVPPEIGALTQLRELTLCKNRITELPDTFGGLRSLRTLELMWNRLGDLPDPIGDLTELRTLQLRGNPLTVLPKCLTRLNRLETLTLGENSLLDVADACRKLAHIPSLKHLCLAQMQLTRLPDEIGLLTQLTSLNLSFNQLSTVPEAIGNLTNLTHIDVSHNAADLWPRVQVQLTGVYP